MWGSHGEVRVILSKVKVGRELAFSLRRCLYGFLKKKPFQDVSEDLVLSYNLISLFPST